MRFFTTLALCLFGITHAIADVVTTGSFTGGDDTDGLDFRGEFVYAVNVRGAGGEVVGDATFTNDAASGVTILAQNNINTWHNANYGDTDNDNALESVMSSIRWSNRGSDVLTLELANLVIGKTYSLQLLFAESGYTRGFDVSVEGEIIVDDFAPYVVQGGTNITTAGAFVRYEFIASDTILNIALGGLAPAYSDNNPILQAVTLEDLNTVDFFPVVEYHFDETSWGGSPGEVIDSSGNNLNGSAVGDTTTVEDGQVCSAGTFDGTGDYINVSGIDAYLKTTASVSFWMKSTQVGGNRAWTSPGILGVEQSGGGDDIFWGYLDNSGRLRIQKGNGSAAISNTVVNDDNWHHIVLTWESTSGAVQMFVNGTLEDSAISEMGDVGTDFSSIGRIEGNSGFSFIGQLDELMVFDSVISESNVNTIYTNQLNGASYSGSERTCPLPPPPPPEECEVGGGTLLAVGIKIDNGGSDPNINTTTEALTIYTDWLASDSPGSGILESGTYNVAASGSSSVDRIDFGGSARDFAGTLPYPGANTGVTGSDFLVHTSGTLTLPAGDYTIFVKSDDGFSFVLDKLSGDDVTFNKFGGSSAGNSNELRYENPTGNSNTGGSFTLTQDSVFDIAAIFFERGGGDFLEISIVNDLRTSSAPSGYEVLRHGAIDGKVQLGQCSVPSQVDHYRIEHDTQGFTCEAETVTIKACVDTNCDTLFDQETTIDLSPTGWSGGDTLVFTGELTTNLNITQEGTFTLVKTAAVPDAGLRCFNGSTETCDITFSNDGFEIFGANIGDPLPDQVAAAGFLNVNVRAVRSVRNVCEALLEGPQQISLSYDCDLPDQCLTPLNSIGIVGEGTGANSGNIDVVFDNQGVANLGLLNYPDAGRLKLNVEAVIEGVTFDSSDQESIDVYPSYLALSVAETELIYGGTGNQNNYVAAESFTFVVGAYGINDQLLPNYQAETPQLKVTKITPNDAGKNGDFKYSESAQRTSNGVFSDIADISSSSGEAHFEEGEYRFDEAYYTEVGRIELDLRDADYLGNTITSKDTLTLGDFYPAYFQVAQPTAPILADTCGNTFSYLGQNIHFDSAPELTLTAYNAIGGKTQNYSAAYWNYQPDESTLEATLSYVDSSTYAKDDSASVIDHGDAPIITSNDNYDGTGTVTIYNGHFRYNKVNPIDKRILAPVSPFDAKITLEFSSDFFRSSFVDQNGNEDTICYQANHTDNTCLGWDIEGVAGTKMRYGRLTLDSTYGPENESLSVPIKAEYFDAGQWRTNSDDNCTNVAFTQTAGHILLTAIDSFDTNSVGDVQSAGELRSGESLKTQLKLNAPEVQGQLKLSLDPAALDADWAKHLNYDWNSDGYIDDNDFPEATITFGLFRGNDRIIHWREVFN